MKITEGKRYVTPTFTLKEGMIENWREGLSKNQDDYGFCIYEYANEWATLMEKAIYGGEVLKNAYMELSHVADENRGITGYMFSCAIGILRHWWLFGDVLADAHDNKIEAPTDPNQKYTLERKLIWSR